MSITVAGFCPMGCGRTLFLAPGGGVTCSWERCPNPSAVADILADSETEHIVELGDETFSIQHPLRERLLGELFICDLHAHIAGLDGPPRQPGRWRVLRDRRSWFWERTP